MAKLEAPKLAKAKSTHRMAVSDASKVLGDSIKKIRAKGIDLGEGYFLVKIRRTKRSAQPARGADMAFVPQQLPGVPAVSHADLQELIQRYQRPHAIQAQAGASTVPPANQAFLDQFSHQELERYARLEKKGELIDSRTLAGQMGVTRQAISKAVTEQRMFSLDSVAGKKLYPAFYADPALNRRQLGKVSKELGHLAGSSKWQFFTHPRMSLNGNSPINALRKGRYADVVAAAIAFREA
ncbi:hypothetical protein CSQ91_06325 [Janthinobacterium sp. BJB301]|uniref:hypothetical protein n=1 Tax=Janthinobacterium sp. BJB301 TaxID=1560195 RepID=UPI000C0C8632|nr:hypothetical protein [Janthinobacterium sp. BJB301]PHV50766.1 hypothetical protein CSQ91_06325 [Janthinobacterium sp. BJB301]